MRTPQDFTTARSDAGASELEALLERVERLRRLSLLRPDETPPAPWMAALHGREIRPGLVMAERRFPLWYRHAGRELACLNELERTGNLSIGAAPLAGRVGFLSLLPALLDDGSPRLCLVTWGRLEDAHFVIRQGLACAPGREEVLLDWLHGDMGKVDAVACAGGRGAWLAAANLRHGREGLRLPAFVEPARPAPAGNLTWRGLRSLGANRAGELYRRQRDSVLGLATALGMSNTR